MEIESMDSTVLIMMASYNGKKYIEEQIESIRSQTYPNWKLIIQDDGSTDGTLEIVEKYAASDKRICLWKRPKNVRHGAYYNFHSMIHTVREVEPQYDYYMFSDHDDIWHEKKIEVFVEEAERKAQTEKDERVPRLFYADMQVVDGNGSVTIPSMNSSVGIRYHNRFSPFYCHSVSGCNILLNRALFYLAPPVDTDSDICSIVSHDNYFAKLAALTGELVYIDKVLMSYRRYGENVTAKQEYNYGLRRILKRLSGLDDLAKDHALTYNQALFSIHQYRTLKLTDEQETFLNDVETSIRQGGMKGLQIVEKYDISWGRKVRTTSRKAILTLGLYKKYLRSDVSATRS